MSQSEVARIREQIELEYQAAQQVFTGFTPTGRHAFITKRQENIGACFEELKQYLSPEEAIKVVIQAEVAVCTKGEAHVSS
jgi:hypothetical protein